MPTGAAHRFSDTNQPAGGNLTADNVNSLDAGLNVYVSPTGGLFVRVSPGVIWRVFAGAATRSNNAGQTVDLAVDPSATSYIYLDADGVVTKGSAWPTTPHLPLAEVVASGSAITSITDRRPRHVLYAEGGPAAPGPGYTAGDYHGARPHGGSDVRTLTADTLYLLQVDVVRRVTIDRLAVEVTTLHASLARLGIYPEGATPGSPAGATLLQDGGTFSVGTTGVKESTVALTLQPGRYFIALVAGNATAAFRAYAATEWAAHGLSPTNFSNVMAVLNGGAHDEGTNLPATCPAVTAEAGLAPVVAFRVA